MLIAEQNEVPEFSSPESQVCICCMIQNGLITPTVNNTIMLAKGVARIAGLKL